MNLTAFREHPFIRSLSPEQTEQLHECLREVAFDDDTLIFREGEPAGTHYLLRTGCVALEVRTPSHGVIKVETLRAGDILGLSWLFPAARWTLDARSVGPVEAFALDANCLHERMREDNELAVAVLTQMVHALYARLMHVRLQRLDVYRDQW